MLASASFALFLATRFSEFRSRKFCSIFTIFVFATVPFAYGCEKIFDSVKSSHVVEIESCLRLVAFPKTINGILFFRSVKLVGCDGNVVFETNLKTVVQSIDQLLILTSDHSVICVIPSMSRSINADDFNSNWVKTVISVGLQFVYPREERKNKSVVAIDEWMALNQEEKFEMLKGVVTSVEFSANSSLTAWNSLSELKSLSNVRIRGLPNSFELKQLNEYSFAKRLTLFLNFRENVSIDFSELEKLRNIHAIVLPPVATDKEIANLRSKLGNVIVIKDAYFD